MAAAHPYNPEQPANGAPKPEVARATLSRDGCVSLVGMAGAGKTTIGRMLADSLGWAQVDTDNIIEAYFGAPLQAVFDSLGREEFLRVEEESVVNLGVRRCVISTGGSVVYGDRAVRRLRDMGPIIHLHASFETVRERIARKPDRGLAVAEGQTLEDLYNERVALYEAAADFVVNTGQLSPDQTVLAIRDWLDRAAGREAR